MRSISSEAVRWAYQLFLDREPDNEHVVQQAVANLRSTQEVREFFLGSEEYSQKHPVASQSPFFHYASSFEPIGIMRRHAAHDLKARPGFLTNFLGVAIDPKFFPTILEGKAGEVEQIPIPANWHADIAEWGTALRAVELADNTFTMIELGCGWGCWMNNTGVAARATGRGVNLIGIEGDEHHLQFARESLATNGFSDTQISLHRGIASSRAGVALFPRQDIPGTTWGSEPIFDASESQRSEALASGHFDELPMVPLAHLIGNHSRIDLLHVDIQGGEADLVRENLELLGARVAYILIGTHSKQIEGDLYDMLLSAGWALEMERAAIFDLVDGTPRIRVDGVQGWRNRALLPV